MRRSCSPPTGANKHLVQDFLSVVLLSSPCRSPVPRFRATAPETPGCADMTVGGGSELQYLGIRTCERLPRLLAVTEKVATPIRPVPSAGAGSGDENRGSPAGGCHVGPSRKLPTCQALPVFPKCDAGRGFEISCTPLCRVPWSRPTCERRFRWKRGPGRKSLRWWRGRGSVPVSGEIVGSRPAT
jgi:hypothetical protein